MHKSWPAWRYSTSDNGEMLSQIFECEDDVPEGWVDTPAKLKLEAPAPKKKPGRPKKAAAKESEG